MSLPDPLQFFRFDKLPPVYGLKYVPTIVPNQYGTTDLTDYWPELASHFHMTREFSVENEILLLSKMVKLKPNASIMEIGVQKPDNKDCSSTQTIMRALPPTMKYFGVDIEDRSQFFDGRPNARFFRSDSGDLEKVNVAMSAFGIGQIDLLFIDGWHCVNQVVKDWQYVERLAPDGVVLIHDTNSHPGPVLVFMAIDDDMFEKRKHFEHTGDWGMGEIRRKK